MLLLHGSRDDVVAGVFHLILSPRGLVCLYAHAGGQSLRQSCSYRFVSSTNLVQFNSIQSNPTQSNPCFSCFSSESTTPSFPLCSVRSSVQGLDLPINTFSCTVGLKLSQANYYIKSSLAAAALCKEASFGP